MFLSKWGECLDIFELGRLVTFVFVWSHSCDEDGDDPEVKAQREKERRQANNARER